MMQQLKQNLQKDLCPNPSVKESRLLNTVRLKVLQQRVQAQKSKGAVRFCRSLSRFCRFQVNFAPNTFQRSDEDNRDDRDAALFMIWIKCSGFNLMPNDRSGSAAGS